MTLTPNVKGTHIEASQEQKEVTSNELDDRLDNSNNGSISINVSAGGTIAVSGDPATGIGDFYNNFFFLLDPNPGSPTEPASAFEIEFPDGGRHFAVINNTKVTATLRTTTTGGLEVTLSPGESAIISSTGESLYKIGA